MMTPFATTPIVVIDMAWHSIDWLIVPNCRGRAQPKNPGEMPRGVGVRVIRGWLRNCVNRGFAPLRRRRGWQCRHLRGYDSGPVEMLCCWKKFESQRWMALRTHKPL